MGTYTRAHVTASGHALLAGKGVECANFLTRGMVVGLSWDQPQTPSSRNALASLTSHIYTTFCSVAPRRRRVPCLGDDRDLHVRRELPPPAKCNNASVASWVRCSLCQIAPIAGARELECTVTCPRFRPPGVPHVTVMVPGAVAHLSRRWHRQCLHGMKSSVLEPLNYQRRCAQICTRAS